MPCTTILVGKNASYDGSTIIARNDDGPFDTKKVVVMKPDKQPKKYKSVISHVTVDLPESGSITLPLQVEWHFGGSYSGTALDVIECGGNVTLSR